MTCVRLRNQEVRRRDKVYFMSRYANILDITDKRDGELINSLRDSFGKDKKQKSEFGGYMSPGEEATLPQYYVPVSKIRESFIKDVIEVIDNAE